MLYCIDWLRPLLPPLSSAFAQLASTTINDIEKYDMRTVEIINGELIISSRKKSRSKWHLFFVELFLPLMVATSASLGSVYFALLHPEIIAVFFGTGLGLVAAPVILLIAGMVANWLLYKRPVPNTFKLIHNLLLDIKSEPWTKKNVFRLIGFIFTLTYASMIGAIVYLSVSKMLLFYATKILLLIGAGTVAVSPIGITIATLFFLSIVFTTTVCLLFNDFDALVCLLLDRPRLKEAWKNFKKNFERSNNESTLKLCCRNMIFTLLLFITLYFAVISTLAMIGIAAPILLGGLVSLSFISVPTATILIAILSFAMALPSRIPFAVKGLLRASIYLVNVISNPSKFIHRFLKEMRFRSYLVRKAWRYNSGAKALAEAIKTSAEQFIWPIIKTLFVAINALGTLCMGSTGGESPAVRKVITIDHLIKLSNDQVSTISGVVVFTKDSSTIGYEAYHANKTPSFWSKVTELLNKKQAEITVQSLEIPNLTIIQQLVLFRHTANIVARKLFEERFLLSKILRSEKQLVNSLQKKTSSLEHKYLVSELLSNNHASAEEVSGNYSEIVTALQYQELDGIDTLLVSLQFMVCQLTELQLENVFSLVLARKERKSLGSSHYNELQRTVIAVVEEMKKDRQAIFFSVYKQRYDEHLEINHLQAMAALAETDEQLRICVKNIFNLVKSQKTQLNNTEFLVVADVLIDKLGEIPPDLHKAIISLLSSSDRRNICLSIKHLANKMTTVPHEYIKIIFSKLTSSTTITDGDLVEMLSILEELMPRTDTVTEKMFSDLVDIMKLSEIDDSKRVCIRVVASILANKLSEKQRGQRFSMVVSTLLEKLSANNETIANDFYFLVASMTDMEASLTSFYVDPLLKRLNSENDKVTVDALHALINLSSVLTFVDPGIFDRVIKLAFSVESSCREEALATLLQLIKQDVQYKLIPLLSEEQQIKVQQALMSSIAKPDAQYSVEEVNQLKLLGYACKLYGIDSLIEQKLQSSTSQSSRCKLVCDRRSAEQKSSSILAGLEVNNGDIDESVNALVLLETDYPGIVDVEAIPAAAEGSAKSSALAILRKTISNIRLTHTKNIEIHQQLIKELTFYQNIASDNTWQTMSIRRFFVNSMRQTNTVAEQIPTTIYLLRKILNDCQVGSVSPDKPVDYERMEQLFKFISQCRQLMKKSNQKWLSRLTRHEKTQHAINDSIAYGDSFDNHVASISVRK